MNMLILNSLLTKILIMWQSNYFTEELFITADNVIKQLGGGYNLPMLLGK